MAAANTLPQNTALQKVLECPLCLHQLENPRRLQKCYHSFCDKCLDEAISSSEDITKALCPVCESPFVTETEVSDNTFLSKLLHALNKEEIVEVNCKQCPGTPKTAVNHCTQCKLELCSDCSVSHLKIPFLSDHCLTSIKEESVDEEVERKEGSTVKIKVVDELITCSEHGKPFELNCVDCMSLICPKCVDGHAKHDIESVKVTEDHLRDKGKELCQTLEGHCEVLKQNVSVMKTKVVETKDYFENCNNRLDMHVNALIEKLRAIKDTLKSENEEKQKQMLTKLENKKQKFECRLAQCEQLLDVVSVVSDQTKNTTYIEEMRGGLLSSINAFVGTKLARQITMSLPVRCYPDLDKNVGYLQKLFGELQECQKRLQISPYGPVNEFYPVENYTQVLCGSFSQQYQIKRLQCSHRMSYINGEIWLPHGNSVNIYSKKGTLSKALTFGRKLRSIKMTTKGDLIYNSVEGLFCRRTENGVDTLLVRGDVIDMDTCGMFIAALKSKCQIVILKLNSQNGNHSWNQVNSFEQQGSGCDSNDTLLVNSEYIFICTYFRCLKQYTHTGELVFQSSGLCGYGYLVGHDRCWNLLYCNIQGVAVTSRQVQGKEINLAFGKGIQSALDVVIDSDMNVWILHRNKDNQCCLTKFCRQTHL